MAATYWRFLYEKHDAATMLETVQISDIERY
jgi:hypothetical protein